MNYLLNRISIRFCLCGTLLLISLSLFLISPVSALEQGSAYYWNFNGNSNELVKGKYNGKDTGVNYVDGKFGKAAEFVGDASYIDFGETDINFGKSFTIAFWMNATPNPNSNFSVLMAKGPKGIGHIEIYIYPEDGTLRIYAPDMGDFATDFVATDNEWHHVAVVYESLQIKLYVDGVESYSGTATADVSEKTDYFIIGSYDYITYPYFGLLDEMYILSWSVDTAKVNEIMNNSFKLVTTATEAPNGTATSAITATPTTKTATATSTSTLTTTQTIKPSSSLLATIIKDGNLNKENSNFSRNLIIGIIVIVGGCIAATIIIVIKKRNLKI